MQDLIPAVGIIRQSKEKDSKLSPDTQRGGITTYAETRGMFITRWFEEIDVPGDAFRPMLEQALGLVEAGRAQAVITWKLDRLGREPEGLYSARGRIERAGGSLHFADEDFDLNSEAGDYLFAMFAARAKAERRRIAANWKRATAAANLRGVHQGNVYGYDRVKGQPLTVNEAQAPGARIVFEMRAAKKSWKQISDRLLAEGFMPLRQATWTPNTLSYVIGNRAYLGEARQGDLVNKGAHPALVSHDLWIAANRVQGSAHARTEDWLLSGKIRCQVCRGRMTGDKSAKKYRCRHGHIRLHSAPLDEAIKAMALDRHELLLEGAHAQLDIVALNEAVGIAEREMVAFTTMMSASSRPDLFAQGLQDRESALVKAERDREHALALYAPEGVNMIFSLRDELANATVPEWREALAGLIDFIVVCPSGEWEIVWRGMGASLGPVPKTGGGQKGGAPRVFPPFPWPLTLDLGEREVGMSVL